MEDERTTRLHVVLPGAEMTMVYIYDLGDDWRHEVFVEEILPPEKGAVLPVCLDGRRACPPEDVGGTDGYVEHLRVLADPSDPEHQEALD